jgi:hypothetical protein
MEDITRWIITSPERLNTSPTVKQIAEIQEKRDRMTKGGRLQGTTANYIRCDSGSGEGLTQPERCFNKYPETVYRRPPKRLKDGENKILQLNFKIESMTNPTGNPVPVVSPISSDSASNDYDIKKRILLIFLVERNMVYIQNVM